MLRKLFSVLFLSVTVFSLYGQQELSLHFLKNTWQASKTNPAFMTEHKVHYGLPNLYFNISHTGPSYNDVVVRSTNGENVLDIDRVLNGLSNDNQLFTNIELETTSFSFGLKKLRLSFNHAFKLNAFIDYPKDMVEMAWNGNSQFIDQTVQVGPDFQAFAYNEFGFGAAMKFLNVSAGARLKILTGIGDASSERTSASIYTSPDVYQLTVGTDYRINSSSFLAYDGSGDFELDFGDPSFENLFTSNLGLAIDLGASVDLGKLDINASIIDLGFINWKRNATNYTSKGDYTYEGLEVSDIINDESISFEEALDTLSDIFNFEETNSSYRTNLASKFYLSGTYKFNDFFDAGLLVYNELYRSRLYTSVAASASVNVNKMISVGAVYAVRNNTYDNVGLNTTLKLGPVQIFALTDNIISVFQPYDSKNVNARIGLNLVFK